MSIEQASGVLLRNSLSVGRVRYERSMLLVPGTVISQKPSANAMVPSGQEVELTVSRE